MSINFTIEKRTSAPPEAVFETLTDHRRYSEFTPMRKSSLDREGTPAPNGVGAVRRLSLAGPPLIEEVTAYEAPTTFSYKLIKGLPVRDHVGDVTLHPDGSGTRIVYSVRSTPTLPGGDIIMKPILKAGIGQLVNGVVKAAERR